MRIYEWLHSMHFVHRFTHLHTYISHTHMHIRLSHRHSEHFVLQDIWTNLHAGILSLFSVNFLCLLVYLLVLFSFCSFSISTTFQFSTCNVSSPCIEERTNIFFYLCLLQFYLILCNRCSSIFQWRKQMYRDRDKEKEREKFAQVIGAKVKKK